MASPTYSLLLLASTSFIICNAGPLPNITSVDMGLKEGSCALGDVVYMPGDEFPGAGPCERCSCSKGSVQCSQERCEPRPGCKAVHRPDHCCPTYQCDCELEGRIYGNNEKLVDPQDACRVCYCQGGEVVCRLIACFLRDDCQPRHVPGRCCPEYDNCPVRGVTSLPGMTSSIPNPSSMADIEPSVIPALPIEPVKPIITIKEITPVSEIPVITEVKIKEILPSPSIEVAEYSSSKSPLIAREATSEKSPSSVESNLKAETPEIKDILTPASNTPDLSTKSPDKSAEIKTKDDLSPSKISFSTEQDSVASNIFEPKPPSFIPLMGVPSMVDIHPEPLTTKAPIEVEEDLDHNPAFPPIHDDLFLVLSNHDEEIITDQNSDSEHVPMDHEIISVSSVPISTVGPIFKESVGTTVSYISDSVTVTKHNIPDTSSSSNTLKDIGVTEQPSATLKENAMLNMRSVIPTEILNAPSLMSDEVTGDLNDIAQTSVKTDTISDNFSPTEISDAIAPKNLNNEIQSNSEDNNSETNLNDTATDVPIEKSLVDVQYSPKYLNNEIQPKFEDNTSYSNFSDMTTDESIKTSLEDVQYSTTYLNTETKSNFGNNTTESNFNGTTTVEPIQKTSEMSISNSDNQTSSLSKSTEIISRTEFSSIPVETSDQNPRETVDRDNKDKYSASTLDSSAEPFSNTESTNSGEDNTLSRVIISTKDEQPFEIGETTEFILTPLGSQESATDDVELIKVSSDTNKSSAIIEPPRGRNGNVLTDLINLVGDVASISDHTSGPNVETQTSSPTTISDSEELIPVNVAAGYKSKNKNWNLNSITEISIKNKVSIPMNKQKVVEIEDDSDTITDSPSPYDKIEPTTKPPIIDNVSDDIPENKTEKADGKDIEIIKPSYVPNISRRPTKVVMKKSNEPPISEESSSDDYVITSTEINTEKSGGFSNIPIANSTDLEIEENLAEQTTESSSSTQ